MRSSIKINTWPLHHLSCSKSENCLTSTAYSKDAYVNPKTKTRRLMVFTSLILNKGTAAFRPNRHKDQWEWHQCHKHFHSMEYFSRYDVIGSLIMLLINQRFFIWNMSRGLVTRVMGVSHPRLSQIVSRFWKTLKPPVLEAAICSWAYALKRIKWLTLSKDTVPKMQGGNIGPPQSFLSSFAFSRIGKNTSSSIY